MAALHEALKSLGPTDYSEVPVSTPDDLKAFLAESFSNGHLIIDSVPIPAPSGDSITVVGRDRASSTASNASEISVSSARSSLPPPEVEALQKEWKPVKLNPKDNPLGMSVYKLGSKDGKGAWFARRSVHEGLGFTKWKKGLEREFPETMKVQGAPGEGNIRGIGGEKRVGYKNIEGVGKVEVYHLSAQFPGPTAPRDFVTLLITSDQALKPRSENEEELPRHYMVISKPCIHPDAPPREGFIRGQYESVEFIREIPLKKPPKKSASTTNLFNGRSTLGKEAVLRNAAKHPAPLSEEDIPEVASSSAEDMSRSDSSRSRGKTISFAESRGRDAKGENFDNPPEDDECEQNPIEWIMITRSDPGGSVPRFMIERGTPGGIVSDAGKFLNWACAIDIEELEKDDVESLVGDEEKRASGHTHEGDLHDYQTNGHLAGLDGSLDTTETAGGGLYDMATNVAATAGAVIAAHTPEVVLNHLPNESSDSSTALDNGTFTLLRRESMSSVASTSSIATFTSALTHGPISHDDTASIQTETDSPSRSRASSQQEKEFQKLEDKKRKLDEKLSKARQRDESRKTNESLKEGEAMKKAEEKHKNEVAKLEAKKEKEIDKLEAKRRKEEKKADDRKRKLIEKDDKVRMTRELEEAKAELSLLRKEKDILRAQVGDLQAENTAMAAKLGRLGTQGDQVLKEVRQEVGKGGRLRASSLKSMGRTNSSMSATNLSAMSTSSGEKEKDP